MGKPSGNYSNLVLRFMNFLIICWSETKYVCLAITTIYIAVIGEANACWFLIFFVTKWCLSSLLDFQHTLLHPPRSWHSKGETRANSMLVYLFIYFDSTLICIMHHDTRYQEHRYLHSCIDSCLNSATDTEAVCVCYQLVFWQSEEAAAPSLLVFKNV